MHSQLIIGFCSGEKKWKKEKTGGVIIQDRSKVAKPFRIAITFFFIDYFYSLFFYFFFS